MYTCATCKVQACGEAQPEKLPGNCPIRKQELLSEAMVQYKAEEFENFYITSSEMEAVGYGQWSRVKETVEFCKMMNYQKVGLAFCRGLRKEAKVVYDIFKKHGIELIAVMCKAGGIDKTESGIADERKIRPGEFEPMCNPIFQATLLNEQETEFNIVLGLCLGHDSLFYKHSKALVTTLVVKDRVLAHNPAGALYCAEGFYRNKL